MPLLGSANVETTLLLLKIAFLVLLAFVLIGPFFLYPVFLMRVLCMALFACAFNLMLGYVGLLSFGHAMFLGTAGYVSGHALKVWGLPPELAIIVGTAASFALAGLRFAAQPADREHPYGHGKIEYFSAVFELPKRSYTADMRGAALCQFGTFLTTPKDRAGTKRPAGDDAASTCEFSHS